jgi:hypothetical protein
MSPRSAGQGWCRVASVPPALLRPARRRSRRSRLTAAALNGSVALLGNAKRLALSSATGLLALSSVALGTYAGFSAQVSNPGNTFATGSVKIDAYVGSPDTPAGTSNNFGFGTVSDLLPGEPIVKYLDIENIGTLPVTIAMSSTVTGGGSSLDSDATNGLKLEIKRCTGAAWSAQDTCTGGTASTLYNNGRVAPLLDPSDNDNFVSLGTVQPGAADTAHYQLRVTLPDTATGLVGQSSTLQFTWTASSIAS